MDLNKNHKIVVTGISGVIGHPLITQLQQNGYSNVIALASSRVDLTDFAHTLRVFEEIQPDFVFHLAAARIYGIMGNLSNKGLAFYDNIRINTNVIEASRIVNVKKIVAMGTTAIYSDDVKLPMSEDQIWNGRPHFSEAPYAHAKRTMLAQLETYKDHYGMDYAYCVTTNLYGPHDKFDEKNGHVIPALISKFHKAVLRGESLSVWGTGNQERDFIYSEDAARAMILIFEQFSGPINLATGRTITIRNTVDILKKIANYGGDILWDQTKPDGQKMRKYEISKLTHLGFNPRFTFEEALASTYDWYCTNYQHARR